MQKIAIVIPVHNRLNYTKECLEMFNGKKDSLFFKNNETKTIIVDDGSTDGTENWIKTNYPDVIVLKGDGNLWYSGGLNLGIQYALDKLQIDYVLIWETDIFPDEAYFNHLHRIMESNVSNDIISSKILIRKQPDRIFGMGGTFDTRTGFKKLIGQKELDGPEYSQPREVDWYIGQGVLVPRAVFEKIGLMDSKNFPQYHSDVDFSLRSKNAGFRNMVYPELKIWNDTETSGISHIKRKSLPLFIKTLFSIRSNYNIIKDIKFYRIHTSSILSYRYLAIKYFEYIGGYVKWSILGIFGIKRKKVF